MKASKDLNTMESFKSGFKIERGGKVFILTQDEMFDFRFLDKAIDGQFALESNQMQNPYISKEENKIISRIKDDEEICYNIASEIDDKVYSDAGEIEAEICRKYVQNNRERDSVLKAVQIEWDVDDVQDLEHLPKEVDIPNSIDEDCVADYLSDNYGFCVKSFRILLKDSEEEYSNVCNKLSDSLDA